MANQWHLLFSGHLSDAPGRNDSWEEQVRYLGSARWHLRSVGTDFSGAENGESSNERMGTKRLVGWVIERDVEETESGNEITLDSIAKVECEGTKLGERATRLKEIAKMVGASLCVEILEKCERGKWPKQPKAPRVMDVIGVTKRGVWIRGYHAVFEATSSQGNVYLYPPNSDGISTLGMKGSSSITNEFNVKLSRRILGQIRKFDSQYQLVQKSLGRPLASGKA